MTKILWQAKVMDKDWNELEDQDVDELCEKLDDFWYELLEGKMRMKMIDRAKQDARKHTLNKRKK